MRILDYLDQYIPEESEEIAKILKKQFSFLLPASALMLYRRNGYLLLSIANLLFQVFIIVFHIYVLILTSYYLINYNFAMFTETVHYVVLCLISSVIKYQFHNRRQTFLELNKILGDVFFKYDFDIKPIQAQFEAQIKKESKVLLAIPIYIFFCGFFISVASPNIDSYLGYGFKEKFTKDGVNLQLLVPLYYPFDTNNTVLFYIANTLEASTVGVLVITIAPAIFYFILSSQQLIMQFRILIYTVGNLESRSLALLEKCLKKNPQKNYNDMYQACKYFCLVENIRHHQLLIRFANEFGKFVSPMMFAAFLVGTTTLALSVISITLGEKQPGQTISTGLILFTELMVMACLSWYGQIISDVNDEFRFALYKCNWYLYNSKFKRSLVILQTVSAKPIEIVGLNIVPVRLEMFSKIINTGYSYYNLLLAVSE